MAAAVTHHSPTRPHTRTPEHPHTQTPTRTASHDIAYDNIGPEISIVLSSEAILAFPEAIMWKSRFCRIAFPLVSFRGRWTPWRMPGGYIGIRMATITMLEGEGGVGWSLNTPADVRQAKARTLLNHLYEFQR
ncbi:unnamed protein product [Macrosiphum euphorbiae]|uniref:Uncharacterized protein n=1 Tax=Macrosiphum euphorbiae TaxID=13131 RepID=A0AAV0Y7H9_9HEMI|nr:unnamed protein product [Macrosiphum euphorbiae]